MPGKLNLCADYLSRLAPDCPNKKRPKYMKDLQPKEIALGYPFSLPGPGERPELWGTPGLPVAGDLQEEEQPWEPPRLVPRPGAGPIGAGVFQ